MALTAHPNLMMRLKKEQRYTFTPPVGLHDLLQGKLYLSLYHIFFKILMCLCKEIEALYIFFTFTRLIWLTSRHSHFTHRERKPGMHQVGGLLGLTVSVDDLENRKISFSSPWIRLIPWLPSPYPGTYTECALLSKPLLRYFMAQIFEWVE